MAKEKKEQPAKKKKATVSVDIECPCGKKLHVDVFRKRTNEKVKAEYSTWTEVTVPGPHLPGMEPGADKDATVTEPE